MPYCVGMGFRALAVGRLEDLCFGYSERFREIRRIAAK